MGLHVPGRAIQNEQPQSREEETQGQEIQKTSFEFLDLISDV